MGKSHTVYMSMSHINDMTNHVWAIRQSPGGFQQPLCVWIGLSPTCCDFLSLPRSFSHSVLPGRSAGGQIQS